VAAKIEAYLIQLGAERTADERGEMFKLGSISEKDIDAGVVSDEVLQARPLANGKKYKGRSFRLLGEVEMMRGSFVQFGGGLFFAAALVYIVMLVQFRSFLDPLIVLLTVPLGFIGVAAILKLTDTNISVMAFMGMLMMVGIVVEYSNVLVDFANRLVAEGRSPREAIIQAARVRLRPILMTSLTTWLALLPMAIGFGGSDANVPLARTIIGGVIAATILSLIVVPCLYVMLKRANPADLAPSLSSDSS
jgi:multidrug efflux pump subunit AcrB